MSALPGAVNDGLVIAWRTLKRVPRIPELAIFAILQSIMFVVLFAFVFGGAIPLPGRRQLPRVPDARDLHPDARVRVDHDRDRVRRRHDEGHHRPLPLAADGALRRPQRADVRRRHLHDGHPRRADALRPRRRLARALERRRLHARRPADAVLHVRDGLGRRLPRPARADGRDRPAARLPHHLPAHVPLERVRPDRDAAGRASSRSPSGTRSACSRRRRGSCSATRARTRAARSRASTRSSSRCSGRSRSSPCSRRSRCASTARSTARGTAVRAPGTIRPAHGSRPHARAGAAPRHRPLVRPRARRARRRGDRPREPLPRRARAGDGGARPAGDPDPGAVRGRGRRHRSAMRSRSRS